MVCKRRRLSEWQRARRPDWLSNHGHATDVCGVAGLDPIAGFPFYPAHRSGYSIQVLPSNSRLPAHPHPSTGTDPSRAKNKTKQNRTKKKKSAPCVPVTRRRVRALGRFSTH